MISLEIELLEVLNLESESIPISLYLRNNSKEDYKVSSMKFWSNITIGLKKDGQEIPGIKVKPNMANRKVYILVKSFAEVKEKFNFNLDDIFRELTSGEYELTVRFIGNILDKNQKLVSYSPIETNKKFTIE